MALFTFMFLPNSPDTSKALFKTPLLLNFVVLKKEIPTGPLFIRTVKVQLLKLKERGRKRTGQKDCLAANHSCAVNWKLLLAAGQSIVRWLPFLCSLVHCYSRKESPINWPSGGGGFYPALAISPSLSVSFCKHQTFFYFFFGSYLGNKVFCAPTLFELWLHWEFAQKLKRERRLRCLRTQFSQRGEYLLGVLGPCADAADKVSNAGG